MSQTLQSVLCITTNKYLVHVLVVLLHARFSVVGPIPFLLAAIFFSVHPYIGSTTVLPDWQRHTEHIPSVLFSSLYLLILVTRRKHSHMLIGASLSEPHIDGIHLRFSYMYILLRSPNKIIFINVKILRIKCRRR